MVFQKPAQVMQLLIAGAFTRELAAEFARAAQRHQCFEISANAVGLARLNIFASSPGVTGAPK